MTAITVSNSAKLTGLVTDRATNTNNRAYKIIVVEDAAASANETYDLTNIDASITGIAGVLGEFVDGAVATTASTWSSTTITVKNTGAYIGSFVCY